MTSNDAHQYVTVEMFNSATNRTEMRFDMIDQKLNSIDRTLTSIGYELRFNARDNEHLQTSVYWGFAILGIVIAVVGVFAPLLLELFRDTRKAKKNDNMKEIAREVMREEIREAVRENMRASGVIGK
ncbi:MAG: hypothetical protein IJQ24_10850 [Synergistaceae bacterium]|nr:hypothetical protein [Synergistaceae bacterium]